MPKRLQNKDYERLGRTMVDIFETGYSNRKSMLKANFLKGLATGFGGILGATILVAILAGVLSLFDEVPLVGPFVERLNDTVKSRQ